MNVTGAAHVIALITSACFALPLGAQMMVAKPSGQWVKGTFVLPQENGTKTLRTHPKGKVLEEIATPLVLNLNSGRTDRSSDPYVFQDAWYAVTYRRGPGDGQTQQTEFVTLEGATWKPLGRIAWPRQQGSPRIYPYGAKAFLFVTKAPLPQGAEGPWSPFQVFTIDAKGEFVFKRTLPHHLEVPTHLIETDLFAFQQTVSEDHLVVTAPCLGHAWSFDLAKGRPGLSKGMFGEPLLSKAFINLPMLPAILTQVAMADGTVLIASRSEEGVRRSYKAALEFQRPIPPGDDGARRLRYRQLSQATDLAFADSPFIWWWSLDPERRTLRRQDPPPKGCLEMAHSLREWDAYRFRPRLDGALDVLAAPPAMKDKPELPAILKRARS